MSVGVIVVDNGSTDDTALEATSARAKVVSEPRRGYGYACAAGVSAAQDADVLVFMDGDYSFSPADLPLIASANLGRSGSIWCWGRANWAGIEPGAMPLQPAFRELAGHRA